MFEISRRFRKNRQFDISEWRRGFHGRNPMDLEWISLGTSIPIDWDRSNSMISIRNYNFSKCSKFREDSQKTVNSTYRSDAGASMDEIGWISSGYHWGHPFPSIGIDWTRWSSSETIISQNVRNFEKIQKKPSIRHFGVTQGLPWTKSDGSRVDITGDIHSHRLGSIELDDLHPKL